MPRNKWKPLLDEIAERYSDGKYFTARDIIRQISDKHFVPNAFELSAYISKDGRFKVCGKSKNGFMWGVKIDKRK